MIPPILQSVQQACNDFYNNTGIQTSPQAVDFMAGVVSLVTEDPHPTWNIPGGNVEKLTQAYQAAVPIFLYQILKQMEYERNITAFDVVHWLAFNLDQFICVIKK